MNSGVGPATSNNTKFLTKDGAQAFLNNLLYAGSIELRLPARVVGAEVGYFEEISQGVSSMK